MATIPLNISTRIFPYTNVPDVPNSNMGRYQLQAATRYISYRAANVRFGYYVPAGFTVSVRAIRVHWNSGANSAQLTFSGNATPTWSGGASGTLVWSDVVTGLANYEGYYTEATYVDSGTATDLNLGNLKLTPYLNDRFQTSDTDSLSDLTATPSSIALAPVPTAFQSIGFLASAVKGDVDLDAEKARLGKEIVSVMQAGDSRTIGTLNSVDSEGPGGIFARIHKLPSMQLSLGGSGLGSFITRIGTAYGSELASLCNHVIFNYGINDFRNQAGTSYGISYFALTKSTLEGLRSSYPANDYKFTVATVWVENSPGGATGNDTRLAFNSLVLGALTASNPTDRIEGLVQTPDFAKIIETSPGGLHRSDTTGVALTDSIHSTAAGDRFMAADIEPYPILGINGTFGPQAAGAYIPSTGDRILLYVGDPDEMRSITIPSTVTGITVSTPVSGAKTVKAVTKQGRNTLVLWVDKVFLDSTKDNNVTVTINPATVNITDHLGRKLFGLMEPDYPTVIPVTSNASTATVDTINYSTVFDDAFTGTDGDAPSGTNYSLTTGWQINGNKLKPTATTDLRTANTSANKRLTFDIFPPNMSAGDNVNLIVSDNGAGQRYTLRIGVPLTGGTTFYYGLQLNGSYVGGLGAALAPATISDGIRFVVSTNGLLCTYQPFNATTGTQLTGVTERVITSTVGYSGIRVENASSYSTGTFDNFKLELQIADTTGPVFASAQVLPEGRQIMVTLTETENSTLLPSTGITGFTTTAGTVSSAVAVAKGKVLLHLAPGSEVNSGASGITVSLGTTNLTDGVGNAATTFSGQAVTNNSTRAADSTAPTLYGAWVNPNGLDLYVRYSDAALSHPLSPATNPTGLSVRVNSSAATVSSKTRLRPDAYVLRMASPILKTATVDFSVASSDIADARGNAVGNLTNQAVNNESLYTFVGLSAGSVSVTGQTSTTVSLSVTVPTGGTAPYTYQVHRSTTSGFTPSGGTAVSGMSGTISGTVTPTDTGLSPSTTYYYKVVYGDAAAGSATSSQATGTTSALPLTAGTASVTGRTATSVSLTATAPTGGTAPYTYQWHRSTSSGFTPGGGTSLAGKTTLSITDTGLTTGTTYYYKLVQNDSASGSVTTAQVFGIPQASQYAPGYGNAGTPVSQLQPEIGIIPPKGIDDNRLERINDWAQVYDVQLLDFAGFAEGTTGSQYVSEAAFLSALPSCAYRYTAG